jgi:integrase
MSTYQDGTGRWRYRWQEKQRDGSLLKASGTPRVNTRKGAEEAERLAIAEARKGPAPKVEAKSSPMFAEFAKTFMSTYAATNNKPSERTAKDSILRTHLLPALGDKRLDQIGTGDVEALKAKLLVSDTNKDGVSAKRVNNVLHVLSKILTYALELELVDRTPKVKPLKTKPAKFDFLTEEELDALVEGAKPEPMWLVAVLLAAEAGLRLGELQALKWAHVDLGRGQLQVIENHWRGQVGAPKGGRDRVVPLTPRLKAALKDARHLRGPLVLCRDDGSYLSNTNFVAAMKRMAKRGKVRRVSWHPLRHTFCSHLAMRGAPAVAIKELAGHTTIAVTNRYMHLAPGGLTTAIALLAAR